MEKVFIPQDAKTIVSTSSKGDQSKWLVGGKWIKENTRGYENMAEYVASLILQSSTLPQESYISYTPCLIEKADGTVKEGCYSLDFRGPLQEVTLERLFEAHFETTDEVLNNTRYSTVDKFNAIMEKVHHFTGLDVTYEMAQMLAFDAFILNEDRHTNNILFLFNPKTEGWQLAPIFDHGLSLLSDLKDYPMDKSISVLKRKLKAKPFNSSFTKQLALFKGPFIQSDLLLTKLEESPYDIGRTKDVVLSQLKDVRLQQLIIN
ncbi:hypothetical protein BpOF4_21784 (plasmid) [Alkalihalophilus pseudofirmus OF4]|uniref:PI3K/PI4K catalytic domain-containing protein n=1 Tax=Alkalihalophilus pseudofirmus (strain ATCC BAA-2126 / JCM 17055 / OF4) TaxID=398511 RepID=D3G1X6_ALKPO|nr:MULTISPECIES: hypothetical protein [Alkalihalophilus]ADC52352.1 hypothetical protein BpOF4_21784 [Alkalihalophilus pseudofirmus OF4]MED1602977.1 hypothetical protein [Alkalihalophilus marmarensis]